MRNFTSAHESRKSLVGKRRLTYKDNHIESDNRLSWFLGRLEKEYGDDAFYVHLKRDRLRTAQSFAKRLSPGLIISAYSNGIYTRLPDDSDPLEISLDYCDTVNANIEAFLHNKTDKMTISLESIKEDFETFWNRIGAEGDLSAALNEWDLAYNASNSDAAPPPKKKPFIVRLTGKLSRICTGLPEYLKNA
jgi:hypothetical protein